MVSKKLEAPAREAGPLEARRAVLVVIRGGGGGGGILPVIRRGSRLDFGAAGTARLVAEPVELVDFGLGA